jgi:hypothetical protein
MNILHIRSSQEASRQIGSPLKPISNRVRLADIKNPTQNKTDIQIKETRFRATKPQHGSEMKYQTILLL